MADTSSSVSERRKSRQLGQRTGIDMAPMVDVVFLLICYFLINSTLSRNPQIEVQLPHSETASVQEQENTIIMIQKDSTITVNQQSVSLEDLNNYMRRLNEEKKVDNVVIKGDKEASYQTMISVLDKVQNAGISRVNFATEQ